MNVRDALRRAIRNYPGGVEAIAPRLGKSWHTLDKELRGASGFKLGADEAAEAAAMCVEQKSEDALAYASAVAARSGCMLLPMPDLVDLETDDCMRALGETAREFGELCTEVCQSLVDGTVSDNEMRRIEREAGHMLSKLNALVAAVAARNAAGKPAELRPLGRVA